VTLASTLAFIVAVFVLGITPGPAVVAVTARALASGLRPALAFHLGVVAGDLVLMTLAIFGLAAVAQALGPWFVVVRVAGGLYLIWLGVRLWRTVPQEPGLVPAAPVSAFRRNVLGGLVLTLGNPKAIVFYAAFLPTFVDLAQVAAADIAILAAVVAGVLTVTNMSYGLLAAHARVLFKSRRAMRNFNRAGGTLMIGAGAAVAGS
jgi:threonine/homoserine/homoserine lactone efflux protein